MGANRASLVQKIKMDDAVAAGWLIAAICMTLFIWGNSLVPGTGSSHLSLSVVAMAQSCLSRLGLPSSWLTNLLVRKAAHFSEYALLGVLAYKAFSGGLKGSISYLVPICLMPGLVACADETIQRFVPGRCGTPVDVLIDCCGAAFGILVCFVMRYVSCRRNDNE